MASDPKEVLRRSLEKLSSIDEERKKEKNQLEVDRKNLIMGIKEDLMQMVTPLVERFMQMSPFTKEDITDAISRVKFTVDAPQIPEIVIPEIKVPTINVPAPQVTVNPEVRITDTVPVSGEIVLQSHLIDYKKPIPVILTDSSGMPYHAGNMGGGLNRSKFMIQGVDTSGGVHNVITGTSGRLVVDVNSLPAGGLGGTQYNEDTSHSSGDTGTLALVVRNDAGAALAGDGDYTAMSTDSSGNLRVAISGFTASIAVHPVTPSGQTIVDEGWDAEQVVSAARGTELNDGVLRVVHVSDVGMSVTISGFSATVESHLVTPSGQSIVDEGWNAVQTVSAARGTETNDGVLRVVHVADVGMSVTATQGGTWNVGSITNSVAAAMVDSSGVQYSGSNPVPVTGTIAGITASVASSLIDSSGVQYSGSNPVPVSGTVVVSSVTASAAVSLIDSTGVGYSGSNPVPVSDAGGTLTVDGTVTVGSITASAAVSLIDSTGVGYSGSNPVPAYLVASSANSVIAVGDVSSDAADPSSAPLKIGGIARTGNPTAVAAGDRVSATFDDLGRQVVVPSQVRDLRVTAYATLSSNSETTLLSGATSTYHDLVWIKFANTSSGAVTVDLRETTGGTIIDTYEIPANGVVGVAAPIPIPQANIGGTWTVDYNDSDLSSTTVYVSGLFIKEV